MTVFVVLIALVIMTFVCVLFIRRSEHRDSEQLLLLLCETGERNLDYYFDSVQKSVQKVASYAAYGTDGFSFTGNIAGWIDRTFMPGRLHEGIFDPDGLLGKVTGTVTAMLGVFAGELLRRKDVSGGRKALILAGAGILSLAACLAWRPWCPVNKKIWTSTFILAAGAYSFLALALFYWIVDVKGWRGWTFFFRVIGMNSITIYVMMRFVEFRSMSKFFFSGVAGLGNVHWSALVLCLGQVALEWLVLLYLYRKGTFLKV